MSILLTKKPFQSQAHNANSPNHSRRKWLSDVVRNDCSVNFHQSKLSIAKFSILYDISLVRDWKRKLKLITPGRHGRHPGNQLYNKVCTMKSSKKATITHIFPDLYMYHIYGNISLWCWVLSDCLRRAWLQLSNAFSQGNFSGYVVVICSLFLFLFCFISFLFLGEQTQCISK